MKRVLGSEEPLLVKKLKMSEGGSVANGGPAGPFQAEIDEDLHSRQLAVYGRESMRKMAASNVLICGATGLGVEVGTCLTTWYARVSGRAPWNPGHL